MKGFTLIELCIVLVILGILGMIAYGAAYPDKSAPAKKRLHCVITRCEPSMEFTCDNEAR